MNTTIATIVQLQAIPQKENGEPLIDLTKSLPAIRCHYHRRDSGVNAILVRESIRNKLQKVQKQLEQRDPEMQLLVTDGYRPLAYQEHYYLKELLAQFQKNPSLDFASLVEHTHQLVALPSVAGHPTGGAVDLTLGFAGKEIDMGGNIADFSIPELLPTYSPRATPEQLQWRILLHDLMLAEGFAPFYGEWWHFSYGDREWAAFYGHPQTLYAPLSGV